MTCWILDPGHEGVSPGGYYFRQGKRSPEIGEGIGIYEGEFNREICSEIHCYCESREMPCIVTNPGPINISLALRRKYIDRLHADRGDCVVVSVHANASRNDGQWGQAHGATTFHMRRGASENSVKLAGLIQHSITARTPMDDRGVRSANFSILRCVPPAVLVECGFMDNREDAAYLASGSGRMEIAEAIFYGMLQYQEGNNVRQVYNDGN